MLFTSVNINGEQFDYKHEDRFDFKDIIKKKIARKVGYNGLLTFVNLNPVLNSIEAVLQSRGTFEGDFVYEGDGQTMLGKILISHTKPEIRSKDMVILRFHKSEKVPYLDGQYHHFKHDNDVQELPIHIANQILMDYPDNFEILQEFETLEYAD